MKKGIVALILFTLVINLLSVMAYGAAPAPPDEGRHRWQDLMRANFGTPLFKFIYIAAILVNVVLLFALLLIYISSYRKTKSSFTLGLVFFIGVLLLQRLLLFVFPLIPPFFETFALLILLMLSME